MRLVNKQSPITLESTKYKLNYQTRYVLFSNALNSIGKDYGDIFVAKPIKIQLDIHHCM